MNILKKETQIEQMLDRQTCPLYTVGDDLSGELTAG